MRYARTATTRFTQLDRVIASESRRAYDSYGLWDFAHEQLWSSDQRASLLQVKARPLLFSASVRFSMRGRSVFSTNVAVLSQDELIELLRGAALGPNLLAIAPLSVPKDSIHVDHLQ